MGKVRLQKEKECFFCKTTNDLHEHHIFYGTANRRKSEKYGMKVYLCGADHNLSNRGVHFDHDKDLYLKRYAQAVFEKEVGTRDFFIKEFGKSYL